MTRTILASLLLALAGCTTTYKEPALPSDHPANPSAVQAEPPPPSRTLDLSAADPIQPVADGAGSVGGHDGQKGTGGDAQAPTHQHEGGGAASAGTPQPTATPSAAPSAPANSAALYVCPMHPEVTSDKPDQRCPKCGMKLKKQTAPTTGGEP